MKKKGLNNFDNVEGPANAGAFGRQEETPVGLGSGKLFYLEYL
jgi:hypothetical protein